MQRRVAAIPLSHHQSLSPSAAEREGRSLLFVAYVAYVLSSALALHDIVPDATKHLVFVVGAVWSLSRNPTRSLWSAVITSPLALIYVIGEMPMYAGMVVTLSLSLPLFWRGISSVIDRRAYGFVCLLLFISLIPAMLSLPTMMVDGPFSMTYGRPRLLMGYFHPKEAAIAFAIPMLLAIRINRRPHIVIWALAFLFLWEVGSRNTALSVAMVWALRWHPRWTLTAMLSLIPIAAIWVLMTPDWFDKLNLLTSLRLTIWEDIIRTGRVVVSMGGPSLEDRFGADNFFVEALVLAGPISILLILASVALTLRVWQLDLRGRNTVWAAMCLIVLLFNATFDSGIASTGNLMHAFLWATMLSPMFRRRKSSRMAEVQLCRA